MNKLFVTSDLHSFFTPFKEALDSSGFDAKNKDHWLIVCGDCFDRGPESRKLLNFLMCLERKIIIKGNHEILLKECCERQYVSTYDSTNGTKKTIQDLGKISIDTPFDICCENTWNRLRGYNNILKNYFETENYIFVHSWIPVVSTINPKTKFPFVYLENWRRASNIAWEEAMWLNPFVLAKAGLNKTGKTLVFGHWHCSAGHKLNSYKYKLNSDFNTPTWWTPYQNKRQGIIGLDRCTAYTKKVNIVVLEDNFLNEETI